MSSPIEALTNAASRAAPRNADHSPFGASFPFDFAQDRLSIPLRSSRNDKGMRQT
jgi:hypothetical protein